MLQAAYTFSIKEPASDSLAAVTTEETRSLSRETIPEELIYSEPTCELQVKGVSLDEYGYTAILSSRNDLFEVKKGQSISSTVEVSAISSLGVVLRHSEFQHFVPISKPEVQEDSDPSVEFRENEAFPEAVPVTGLLLKDIPETYDSDISVIADNVLAVRRQVFDGVLNSRDAISATRFAVSSKGGFQATMVEDDSLLFSLGLETGDILKSINGRDLNSVSDLVSIYRELQATESLELRFERQGQEVFYFYQLFD